MNYKHPWVEYIDYANEVHQVREVFLKCFLLIKNPAVHNPILERIEFLRNRSVDAQMVRDLEDLKDDIELEMEHGTMARNHQKKEPRTLKVVESSHGRVKIVKAPIPRPVYEAPKMEDQLLSSNDFEGKSDLLAQVKRELTLRVLKDCKGNRTWACKKLGISIRTLRNNLITYKQQGHLKEEYDIHLVDSEGPDHGDTNVFKQEHPECSSHH
jgi:DNA-binding protein Fis